MIKSVEDINVLDDISMFGYEKDIISTIVMYTKYPLLFKFYHDYYKFKTKYKEIFDMYHNILNINSFLINVHVKDYDMIKILELWKLDTGRKNLSDIKINRNETKHLSQQMIEYLIQNKVGFI